MSTEALYAASKLSEYLDGAKVLGDLETSCSLDGRSFYVGYGKIEDIDNSNIVYVSKDNYRSFDTKTGFQTNHISNRNSGDWKKYFSPKEIKILDLEFKDFISEYKF